MVQLTPLQLQQGAQVQQGTELQQGPQAQVSMAVRWLGPLVLPTSPHIMISGPEAYGSLTVWFVAIGER